MKMKYSTFTFSRDSSLLFAKMVAYRIIEDITGTEKMLYFKQISTGHLILIEEGYFNDSLNRLRYYISLTGKTVEIQRQASELLNFLINQVRIYMLDFVELEDSFRKMCVPYGFRIIDG